MSVRPHSSGRTNVPSSKGRRMVTAAGAVAALGAIVAGGTLSYAQADEGKAGTAQAKAAHASKHRDAVQMAADALVRKDGFPGVLAAVKGRDGRTRDYTAGVADLKTERPIPVNGRVRAASNTKSFTAAVVLQLVGEGKVKLDESIETYLPGLLRGEDIHAENITVRDLLQHTSGLPEYTRYMDPNVFNSRNVYQAPRDLLDTALAHKAEFQPGETWSYSNTNYIVAGLLIQKVTGRPVGEEITKRIIKPLHLKDTYWPGTGDRNVRGAHPKGYDAEKPGAPLRDITRLDPSWGGAAGQLISSPRDLNTFFSSLMDGEVLRPAELKEMRTTVKTENSLPGSSYGLGLFKMPLSCGGALWGHGGDINGYETRGGVTDDGREVTVAVTALPGAIATSEEEMLDKHQHVLDLADSAICG